MSTETSTTSAPFCKSRVIDEQHHWTGGKATFVQLGDLIDRGPKPREVLDLMISLDEQARRLAARS